MQADWNSHGEWSFAFELVEACSPETCELREEFHATAFDAMDPLMGYNLMRTTANGVSGKKRGRPKTGRRMDGTLFLRVPKDKREDIRGIVLAFLAGSVRLETGERLGVVTKERDALLVTVGEQAAKIERLVAKVNELAGMAPNEKYARLWAAYQKLKGGEDYNQS